MRDNNRLPYSSFQTHIYAKETQTRPNYTVSSKFYLTFDSQMTTSTTVEEACCCLKVSMCVLS